MTDLTRTVAALRSELEVFGANGPDTDRLLKAVEDVLTICAGWDTLTDGSAANATEIRDVIERDLTGDADA